MTQIDWQRLEQTMLRIGATEKDRLHSLPDRSLAEGAKATDPLLGLMADDPDLVDQVVASAMTAHERDALRTDGNAQDAV